MRTRSVACLALLACGAACSDNAPARNAPLPSSSAQQTPPPPPASGVRVVDRITRTVPLRAELVDSNAADSASATTALAIRPAQPDQLPEGPSSFDVLPDGGFVVADTVRERLVLFTESGQAIGRINLGTSPSTVTATAANRFRIVSATEGTAVTVDREGKPVADLVPEAGGRGAGPVRPTVRRESDRVGTIRWPSSPEVSGSSPPPDLTVRFEDPNDRLASLQVLAVDAAKSVYVTLQSIEASGRSLDRVGVIVRRYAAAGELQVEVRKIPVDYYVVPSTQFRVVSDVLYQLVPHKDAVLINVWDLR